MRYFTGQFERSLDDKNRIQLPSQLRSAIDEDRDGKLLYITLGEHAGTLSIFTEKGFEAVAARTETEFQTGPDALRFELQFFGLASSIEMDKQGRFVLPDRLLKKARLGPDVVLVGQGSRIDMWDPAALDRSMGIDWAGDEWPNWQSFLRNRPGQKGAQQPRPSE